MIHGSSNDPVLIKRISLKVWTLRDEVETVLARTLRANPELEKLDEEMIASIREEYAYKGSLETRGGLSLVPSQVETSNSTEDNEAGEEASDETGEESDAPEDIQASSEVENSSPVKIIQRSSSSVPSSKVSRGISVLSELSMDSLYFFGGEKFLEGQSIVIEFQIPKKFVVNADIVYCRPFNIRSRIISNKKVSYRVVARFTFLKEGERTLLRQFIQSIEPEIPAAPLPKPKAESNEEADDFDGLDGLDF